MPGFLAVLIALVIGGLAGVGGGLVLVKNQGGGNGYPVQATQSITVYGRG